MSADAGQRDRPGFRDLWFLPKVVRVEIARVRYPEPRQFVIDRKLQEVDEAVEIVVHTSEELPERAVAPVLFVGDHRLTESEPAGFRKYRFFAFDSTALKEDAPISLGWDVAQSPRSETGVRYKLQPE